MKLLYEDLKAFAANREACLAWSVIQIPPPLTFTESRCERSIMCEQKLIELLEAGVLVSNEISSHVSIKYVG